MFINPLPPPFEEVQKKNKKPYKIAVILIIFILITIFLLYVFAYKRKPKEADVTEEKIEVKHSLDLPKVTESSDKEVKIITEEIKPGQKKTDDYITKSENKVSENKDEKKIDLEEKNPKDADTFLFPSDKSVIGEEELNSYDKEKLTLLKNEIYARHGYKFTNKEMKKYFKEKSWYKENEDFSLKLLNDIEKENIRNINKMLSTKK